MDMLLSYIALSYSCVAAFLVFVVLSNAELEVSIFGIPKPLSMLCLFAISPMTFLALIAMFSKKK